MVANPEDRFSRDEARVYGYKGSQTGDTWPNILVLRDTFLNILGIRTSKAPFNVINVCYIWQYRIMLYNINIRRFVEDKGAN